jgi:hypothetical protein
MNLDYPTRRMANQAGRRWDRMEMTVPAHTRPPRFSSGQRRASTSAVRSKIPPALSPEAMRRRDWKPSPQHHREVTPVPRLIFSLIRGIKPYQRTSLDLDTAWARKRARKGGIARGQERLPCGFGDRDQSANRHRPHRRRGCRRHVIRQPLGHGALSVVRRSPLARLVHQGSDRPSPAAESARTEPRPPGPNSVTGSACQSPLLSERIRL